MYYFGSCNQESNPGQQRQRRFRIIIK